MSIAGIVQPDILPVDSELRLRKYDGNCDFAYDWYQDIETVWMIDGVKERYDRDKLERMYRYLDEHGELYWIEASQPAKGGEQNAWLPIGDVTFWQEDMPIVVGDLRYRGRGVGTKVGKVLIERGKSLGYTWLMIGEIYEYNTVSRKMFTNLGFFPYQKTENGSSYRLEL